MIFANLAYTIGRAALFTQRPETSRVRNAFLFALPALLPYSPLGNR